MSAGHQIKKPLYRSFCSRGAAQTDRQTKGIRKTASDGLTHSNTPARTTTYINCLQNKSTIRHDIIRRYYTKLYFTWYW